VGRTTLTRGDRLRTREVAQLLDVDPSTVRRFAAAGILPAIRLTPRSPLKFRLEDVERLLEEAGVSS
jgi:excisionase family DNA binding protein